MSVATDTKGYLKGAWDFAIALSTDPKKAFGDVWRGFEKDIGDENTRLLEPRSLLTFGGIGVITGGLVSTGPASIVIGTGVAFTGLGRYYTIGEMARLKEEADIATKIDSAYEGDIRMSQPDKGTPPPEAHM